MRKAVIASAALHIGVLGAAMISWPSAPDLSQETAPSIPVELVSVGELTNIAPTVREPPPAPEPPEPVPPPAEIEPEPPQLTEAAPPPPEPEPAPAVEPEPAPPQMVQPQPKPPVQRNPRFDVDSVIALLDNRAPRAPAAPQAEQTVRGIGAQSAMTVDLQDALRAQMRECWSAPVGAPKPEELIVEVLVFLAPNGNLARPPQLSPRSRTAAASNPFLRTAAESALRAINICAPYRGLPQDRYNQWREIEMTFDPTVMAGR